MPGLYLMELSLLIASLLPWAQNNIIWGWF